LPVISTWSFTATFSFDQCRSNQWMVRMRMNAACDFSPCADAPGA
jgi:hypothetical protein